MTRVVDTEQVWRALQTRLVYLQTGRLLGRALVSAQLEEEAVARSLGVWHAASPDELAACPDEPTLVIVSFGTLGLEDFPERCRQLANWRAAVTDLLGRCTETRIVLSTSSPKAALGGCPGSQLIADAAAAFVRPEPAALVDAAAEASTHPRNDLERWSAWYEHRPSLVLSIASIVEPGAPKKLQLRAADDTAQVEYAAAFEELGPDILATLDYYVTELARLTVDYNELDPKLIEALRGAAFAGVENEGRTITLLPGKDKARMQHALRTVVDSTTQIPGGYVQCVEQLWFIERALRAEVQRLLIDRHGVHEWKRHVPEDAKVEERLVGRAAQEAFPLATSCEDLPNPVEWLTLGELIALIASRGDTLGQPFGMPCAYWEKLRTELAPVRDRIAHMRLLRDGDDRVVRKWNHQVSRLSERVSSA
jgi:hypothetical protein